MTARHARDETLTCAPVPESRDLPPELDHALCRLIDDPRLCAHPATQGSPSVLSPEPDSGISFTVAPEPESVTAARHFALSRLDDWQMGELRDDVALVVSELVTNALRHSLPPCPIEAPARRPIRLCLLGRAPWLLCGITDAGEDAPRRKTPDFIAESGRGLHLVDSFTARWGWHGIPSGGKVVWALFRVPARP